MCILYYVLERGLGYGGSMACVASSWMVHVYWCASRVRRDVLRRGVVLLYEAADGSSVCSRIAYAHVHVGEGHPLLISSIGQQYPWVQACVHQPHTCACAHACVPECGDSMRGVEHATWCTVPLCASPIMYWSVGGDMEGAGPQYPWVQACVHQPHTCACAHACVPECGDSMRGV